MRWIYLAKSSWEVNKINPNSTRKTRSLRAKHGGRNRHPTNTCYTMHKPCQTTQTPTLTLANFLLQNLKSSIINLSTSQSLSHGYSTFARLPHPSLALADPIILIHRYKPRRLQFNRQIKRSDLCITYM